LDLNFTKKIREKPILIMSKALKYPCCHCELGFPFDDRIDIVASVLLLPSPLSKNEAKGTIKKD
jgi:hypothetical protein